jgi:hypothetical protein
MTDQPQPPPLGHLIAALSAHADVVSLTHVLTVTLADALPAGMVHVERRRSLADRAAGRPGQPIAVSITAGDKRFTLKTPPGGRVEASVTHTVRGVTLSRTPMSTPAWITELATALNNVAGADEMTRAALERLLLS